MDPAARLTGQPTSGARADARMNMFVLATLAAASASGPVKIRNMSPGGAMVEAASLPSAGDTFELYRGASRVRGTVVWAIDGRADLRFDGRVDVAEWMPGGHVGQQRVDQVFQQAKAEASASLPSGPEPAAHDFALHPAQLRKLARAIEALGDDLAEDHAIVVKFATQLQALDLASQVLRKLAERGV